MTPQAADNLYAASFRPIGRRRLAILLLAGGLVGFAAAFVLAVEKVRLLANPFHVPSCTMNATFNCGSVMGSPQAEVFGFPNPLLGIAGFAVVAATGAVLLTDGGLAGWYWAGLQVGLTFGVVFVHWLIFQSAFVIGVLCPYCMAVWVVTIPIFWYVTLRNLTALGPRLPDLAEAVVGFAARYHSSLLVMWGAALTLLIWITR